MGMFFMGQALLGSPGCGSLQHRHQLLWEKLSVVSKSESLAGAALAPGPPLLPGFFLSAGEDSCNWLVDWLIGWLFLTCLIISYLVWDDHNWLAPRRTMYYYSVWGFKFVYWFLNFPVLQALRSRLMGASVVSCGAVIGNCEKSSQWQWAVQTFSAMQEFKLEANVTWFLLTIRCTG